MNFKIFPTYFQTSADVLLGISQLYKVTILRRGQEERNATRFKMLQKNLYLHRKREKKILSLQTVDLWETFP